MSEFNLHKTLAQDSFLIKQLQLSQLRLINNANFPWLILVPMVNDVSEMIDLSAAQQQILLQEINIVAAKLRQYFKADKLNIAMLGNMVAQLHIHIIGRYKDDIAFPQPVWSSQSKPYATEQAEEIINNLAQLICLK